MKVIDFPSWLTAQIISRNWKPTDLAKYSHLSDTAVSRILRGDRNPDVDTLSKIAQALRLPPEQVYRAAGILPPVPDLNETIEQIVHEIQSLPEQDQQEILAFIRMKNNLRNQRKSK
ncbi:helix-turn-helix transcriptional regulator [Chloroflexi bacterium CFX6]|nr:helix-turn-helix transcriptional regulator [Chloroflexi bacterium CFX6]